MSKLFKKVRGARHLFCQLLRPGDRGYSGNYNGQLQLSGLFRDCMFPSRLRIFRLIF